MEWMRYRDLLVGLDEFDDIIVIFFGIFRKGVHKLEQLRQMTVRLLWLGNIEELDEPPCPGCDSH